MKATKKYLKCKKNQKALIHNKDEKLYKNQKHYFKHVSKEVNVFERRATQILSELNCKDFTSEQNVLWTKNKTITNILEQGEKVAKEIELNKFSFSEQKNKENVSKDTNSFKIKSKPPLLDKKIESKNDNNS